VIKFKEDLCPYPQVGRLNKVTSALPQSLTLLCRKELDSVGHHVARRIGVANRDFGNLAFGQPEFFQRNDAFGFRVALVHDDGGGVPVNSNFDRNVRGTVWMWWKQQDDLEFSARRNDRRERNGRFAFSGVTVMQVALTERAPSTDQSVSPASGFRGIRVIHQNSAKWLRVGGARRLGG
jgi:hypothetical protein